MPRSLLVRRLAPVCVVVAAAGIGLGWVVLDSAGALGGRGAAMTDVVPGVRVAEVRVGEDAAVPVPETTAGQPSVGEDPALTAPSDAPFAEAPPVVASDPSVVAEAAGVLPGQTPERLTGAFVVAPGDEPAPGPGPVTTVRVEAEVGLPIDIAAFARFVMATLNDPRGWGADGSVSFARTEGAADIRVLVASPSTVDALCAPLPTRGQWSCGRYGHAALNAVRWAESSPAFVEASGGDLTLYRQYLVNHEVGHLLGKQHTGCPTPGTLAPVMLQQSISLDGCIPNGWPNAS